MPSAKTAAVKVTYGTETRRVGGDYFQQDDEWTAFCHRLRSLLQRDLVGIEEGNTYDVTYKDDDEDTVTIRSTAELREAFKAQGEVARFTVTELSAPRRQPQCGWGAQRAHRGGWWRRHNQQAAAAAAAPAAEPQQSTEQQTYTRRPFWGFGRITRHAAHLNAEAVELMGQNKLSEAAGTLHTAVQKYPGYSPLWYNLACTEALRGNRPDALAALRAAVQNGYRDADHTLSDEDLSCLRSNPEFVEIVQCMRNGDTSNYVENPAVYLNTQLLNFRKEGAIEDAWKVVQSGVEVGIKEPLFLYNAACIGSLLGKNDEAVSFLIDAVLNGYTDQKLIETDDDLDNIRSHQGYFSALNLLAQTLDKQNFAENDDVNDDGATSSSQQPTERPESPQVHTEVAVSASPSLDEVEQEMTEVANESGSVHEWENVEIDEAQSEASVETRDEQLAAEPEPVVVREESPVTAIAVPVDVPPAPPVVPEPVAPEVPAPAPTVVAPAASVPPVQAAVPGFFNWTSYLQIPSLNLPVPQVAIPQISLPVPHIPQIPSAPPAPVPAPVPVPTPVPAPVPVAEPVVPPVPHPATPLETPRTATLMEMGFGRDVAKAALVASSNNVERALEHLLQQ